MEPIEVFVVDNNLGDHQLIGLALAEVGFTCRLEAAYDGIEGRERLERMAQGIIPVCNLVLLDLNMPKMDGRELLEWVRGQTGLAGLPVVILTSSHDQRDQIDCIALGASAFFTKPNTFDEYVALATSLSTYANTRSATR